MSRPPLNATLTSPGALLEDEAKQQWSVQPKSPDESGSGSRSSGLLSSRRRQQNDPAAKDSAIIATDYYSITNSASSASQQHAGSPPVGSPSSLSPGSSSPSSSALGSAAGSAPGGRSVFRRLMSSARRVTRGTRKRRPLGSVSERVEDGGLSEAEGANASGDSSSSSDEEDRAPASGAGATGNSPGTAGGLGSSIARSSILEREAAIVAQRHAQQRRALEETDDVEQSNFATVDWTRQDEIDALQYHRLHEPLAPIGVASLQSGGRGFGGILWSKIVWLFRVAWRLLRQGWRASQGWVLCGLVGIFTGLLASMIDMCVHWVIDFRLGLCRDSIWLSNKSCCAQVGPDNISPARDNAALQQICPLWENWNEVLARWGVGFGPHIGDYATTYLVYVLLSIILACVSSWLVASWSKYAAGSGIPEIKTILGGVVIRKVLGGWTLLTKCVALVLSVSSGLSVGKEGPFVHIAACVANILCKLFARYRHNAAKSNEILSAACAAGVAVAFGAPIGGILYSLEEVSSFFPHKTMWRAFFCSIMASISVQYIDPFQEGKLVQFQINYTNPWNWFEMIPFAAIGALGGLAGAFFVWANLKCQAFRKSSFLSRWPLSEVALVAIVSALIKFQSSFTRGNTTNLLEALFSSCSSAPGIDPLDMCDPSYQATTIGNLLFTTLVTLLLTTYSIGLPVPAGLLIPSLTTGAALGRMVGTGVRWLQLSNPTWGVWTGCQVGDSNCITPGIYALVGGAAVLGGVTRMTIALVVIMFEITGGLSYLLPIMVAVIMAKVVGDSFGTDSIYEGVIHRNNYPFLDVKHEIAPVLKVLDAMTPVAELLCLSIQGHTVGSLAAITSQAAELGVSGWPVVTSQDEMLVVGYITRSELKAGLRSALRNGGSAGGIVTPDTPCYFALLEGIGPRLDGSYVDLSSLLDPSPFQVSEYMALYRLHDMFGKLGLRYCIVSRFGKVVGMVTKKDIVRHLHEFEHQQEMMEHQKKMLPHEGHKAH